MKSTAGFVLALIGGILSILLYLTVSVIFLIMYFGVTSLIKDLPVNDSTSLMVASPPIILLIGGLFILIWGLVFGIMSIVGAVKMKKDQTVKKGGIFALIAGILTFNLFTIIGGIIGIVSSGKAGINGSEVNIVTSNPISANNVLGSQLPEVPLTNNQTTSYPTNNMNQQNSTYGQPTNNQAIIQQNLMAGQVSYNRPEIKNNISSQSSPNNQNSNQSMQGQNRQNNFQGNSQLNNIGGQVQNNSGRNMGYDPRRRSPPR